MDTSPATVSTMLVIALGVVTLWLLVRGHHHSNLPLLFFAAVFVLINFTEYSVNSLLLYSGVGLALVLRFEFMGKGFTKFISLLTTAAIGLVAFLLLDQIFGGTLL